MFQCVIDAIEFISPWAHLYICVSGSIPSLFLLSVPEICKELEESYGLVIE